MIFTGYPWFKVSKESIPRALVRTFPWYHAPYMSGYLSPAFHKWPELKRAWEWQAKESLDRYAAQRTGDCDVLVGLSGSALRAGRAAQRRGALYVCDRGSSHIRYQDKLLREEHERWGVSWHGINPRVIEKECDEYSSADLVTVPSEFVRQSFIEEGFPESKLAKVPYGANIIRFSPRGGRRKDRFVVLFVGQVSLRKGAPYLLEAFSQFRHPKKELWIVGTRDPNTDTITARYSSLPIRWLGRVANEQLASIYSQAHAFVLPSIEEGLAMVSGEALACGCPVIASTNTGASDLFDDGVEGYTVPIRDPESIVDRLTRLADEPQLWRCMSEAALAKVKSLGGWNEYGRQFRSVLAREYHTPSETTVA